MTQPTDSSSYVTLTSIKTQEFSNNSPSHLQCLLPQTLWLSGKWKVGLASLYLPGAPNPISHVLTSHAPLPSHPTIPAAKPSPPMSYKNLSNLYKRTTTEIMFQQYAKAFKSSQSQEFLSKLNKSDLPDATTDLTFWPKRFIGCIKMWTKNYRQGINLGYQRPLVRLPKGQD